MIPDDPWAPAPAPPVHQIGADLSLLSVHELDELIVLLQGEIERLRQARDRKEASRIAANDVFRT